MWLLCCRCLEFRFFFFLYKNGRKKLRGEKKKFDFHRQPQSTARQKFKKVTRKTKYKPESGDARVTLTAVSQVQGSLTPHSKVTIWLNAICTSLNIFWIVSNLKDFLRTCIKSIQSCLLPLQLKIKIAVSFLKFTEIAWHFSFTCFLRKEKHDRFCVHRHQKNNVFTVVQNTRCFLFHRRQQVSSYHITLM